MIGNVGCGRDGGFGSTRRSGLGNDEGSSELWTTDPASDGGSAGPRPDGLGIDDIFDASDVGEVARGKSES